MLLLGGTAVMGAAAFQPSLHRSMIPPKTMAPTHLSPWATTRRGAWTIHSDSSSFSCAAAPTRRATRLTAFLPPGGGGSGDDRSDGLGDVTTAILTFAGITLFFLSPLGGLFFAVFNSLLALAILIPLGGFVAFQVWIYLNTVKGNCPNCATPVQATKDGSPSLCFNCGAVVQAKDGEIYLANPNPRDIFVDEVDDAVVDMNSMGSWINGMSGQRGRSDIGKISSTTTIIDVDAKRDDD